MSALTQPVAPKDVPPPRVQPRPRGGPKWGLWLLLCSLAGGAFAYQAWWKPNQPGSGPPVASAKTAKVTRGPVERTIRVTGQTSARVYGNVTAPIQRGGDRAQMALLTLAKGGSIIKKGDIVAEIDPQMSRDRLDDLADSVRNSENSLAKRKAEQAVEWESLQQTLRVAKASYDKALLEFRTAPTKTEVERELLKLSVDEAEARYKQQQKDQEFRRAAQAADLRIAEIDAIRTRQRVERMEGNLRRFVLKSPMDGLVVLQNMFRGGEFTQIQLGDQLMSGQLIMRIVDPASMQVEATVNQSQSSDLRIGQRVHIGMDAFSDLKLEGRLHSIGALAVGSWTQNYYIRNVPILIAIESRDNRVIPDMSAYGDVVIERADDSLRVPRGAIYKEGGKHYVSVRDARGGFERREVKVGIESDTHVAILAGLNMDEEVRLP